MVKEPLTRVTEVSLERAGSRSEVLKMDSDGNHDKDPLLALNDRNPISGIDKEDQYNQK